MREFVALIAVVVAVALAWTAIWALALHVFGMPIFRRTIGNAGRRERIRRMVKLRYVLIFGVFGPGLAFGLAMTIAGLLDHNSHGWVFVVAKLVFLSVLYGWLHGARAWNEAFRDPVPFPPDFTRC